MASASYPNGLNNSKCDLYNVHIRCVQAMVQIGHSVFLTTIDTTVKDELIPELNVVLKRLSIKEITKREDISKTLQKEDVQVLYRVIRNTPLLPKPHSGWGKEVDRKDMSHSGDIERIRLSRNKYIHSPPHNFSKRELEAEWNDILYLFKRVDQYFQQEHNIKTIFHHEAVQLSDRGMN